MAILVSGVVEMQLYLLKKSPDGNVVRERVLFNAMVELDCSQGEDIIPRRLDTLLSRVVFWLEGLRTGYPSITLPRNKVLDRIVHTASSPTAYARHHVIQLDVNVVTFSPSWRLRPRQNRTKENSIDGTVRHARKMSVPSLDLHNLHN